MPWDRRENDRREPDEFSRAGYARDGAYDVRRRVGYGERPSDIAPPPRSWIERATGGLAGHHELREEEAMRRQRRRIPSDRVLWAVIVERLEAERHLDLRGIELIVEDGDVTLNGTVAHKADKRRIEDIADLEGVHNVQNNLRVRRRGPWSLF